MDVKENNERKINIDNLNTSDFLKNIKLEYLSLLAKNHSACNGKGYFIMYSNKYQSKLNYLYYCVHKKWNKMSKKIKINL